MHFDRRAIKRLWLFLLSVSVVMLLVGCSGVNPGTSESQHEEDTAKEQQNLVVLYVRGFDTDENGQSINREYTLSSEDSELIFELFYEHDKEVFTTPCDSISLIEFRVGDGHLSASSVSMDSLEGWIDGKFVGMDLDDSESGLLKQLVCKYAPYIED